MGTAVAATPCRRSGQRMRSRVVFLVDPHDGRDGRLDPGIRILPQGLTIAHEPDRDARRVQRATKRLVPLPALHPSPNERQFGHLYTIQIPDRRTAPVHLPAERLRPLSNVNDGLEGAALRAVEPSLHSVAPLQAQRSCPSMARTLSPIFPTAVDAARNRM